LLTFAGLELMTDLRRLRERGGCSLLIGAAGEVAIAAVTPVVVLALQPYLP